MSPGPTVRRDRVGRGWEPLGGEVAASFSAGRIEAPEALEALRQAFEQVEALEKRRLEREHARLRVRQHVLELRPSRRRVDRDEDRAEPGARQPGVDHLEPVLRHDRHAIARGDAVFREGAREARNVVPQRDERPGGVADRQERPIAV